MYENVKKTLHTSLKMYKPCIPKTDPPPIRSRSELFYEKNLPQSLMWERAANRILTGRLQSISRQTHEPTIHPLTNKSVSLR
jgi:hypothetical protein